MLADKKSGDGERDLATRGGMPLECLGDRNFMLPACGDEATFGDETTFDRVPVCSRRDDIRSSRADLASSTLESVFNGRFTGKNLRIGLLLLCPGMTYVWAPAPFVSDTALLG
mmetsp:Transcript_39400/g.71742  ORF Transcript_39400/g.71742 Transcript_39400/m.71742 type:complete len:113 (-) Transcript_39400:116-454(-)